MKWIWCELWIDQITPCAINNIERFHWLVLWDKLILVVYCIIIIEYYAWIIHLGGNVMCITDDLKCHTCSKLHCSVVRLWYGQRSTAIPMIMLYPPHRPHRSKLLSMRKYITWLYTGIRYRRRGHHFEIKSRYSRKYLLYRPSLLWDCSLHIAHRDS